MKKAVFDDQENDGFYLNPRFIQENIIIDPLFTFSAFHGPAVKPTGKKTKL
jgi:hypothetical protein